MAEDTLRQKIQIDLAREMTGWKALELRVVADQRTRDKEGTDTFQPITVETRYIQTASGKRYFDAVMRSGRVVRIGGFCDGARSANVSYAEGGDGRQEEIVIGKSFLNETNIGFIQAPAPLQYYYVGLVPLYEAIRDAQPQGPSEVLGRPCHKFLFPSVRGLTRTQPLVYHLDDATSVPLKVSAYLDSADLGADRPAWTWEADSLDAVDGRHVPLNSRYTSFVVLGDPATGRAERRQDVLKQIRVEEIKHDGSYPASMFWPAPQPGAKVIDTIANKVYRVPGAEAAAVAAGPPIRATAAGRADAIAGVTLGLGLALLGAGAALWWRRR